ncbi:MAG: serine O-acetyltransferase EpsC [Bacteroidales bacterium]|nr:serine O-acetyltransferase EpsC [Bacteroidales bacterium]
MDRLTLLPKEIFRSYVCAHANLPPVESTQHFVDELVMFFFPLKGNRTVSLKSLQKELRRLRFRLSELLYPLHDGAEDEVTQVVESFFNQLPDVYDKMLNDAQSFLDSDPSAKGIEEIIMSFPGFYAISVYRIAHELCLLKVPLLPRIMSEYLHSKTGIDIHPAAKIGKNFFIDHGTGVVIGETAEIGDNVKIYQGVTLGALFVERALRDLKRHPTIQDDVIIYAGSTILGGKTVIGRGSVIGGNVWLTESVEPHSLVYHKPQIVIRDKKDFVEPINFFI